MESNTVKISSSFRTLLRFPFSFFPLILLPYLLDISLLWSSFCLLVLFHLLLSFTPPLLSAYWRLVGRRVFRGNILYLFSFPPLFTSGTESSPPNSVTLPPSLLQNILSSLSTGLFMVSLVFWPSVVSASKTIPLSLSLYSSSLPICSPVPYTTTFSFPRFLPSSLCVIHWNYNCIIIMSSRLLAAVAATEKRKENKEGERRKDGETSPEQREATVSNIQ